MHLQYVKSKMGEFVSYMQWVISSRSTAPAIFGKIWQANVICNLKLWKLFNYLIQTNFNNHKPKSAL